MSLHGPKIVHTLENPEKTEILFFSNTGNIDNIEFSFNGKRIPLSTSHKHQGVILSQNAKWHLVRVDHD
jgi:hypothetical protein